MYGFKHIVSEYFSCSVLLIFKHSGFRIWATTWPKPTKWVCTQRRLGSAWASTQSDQSSLCAQWVAKGPWFLHADSEDSDQTGRMPRLIWVFAGRTLILLVLSCRGSYIHWKPVQKIHKNKYHINLMQYIYQYLNILYIYMKIFVQTEWDTWGTTGEQPSKFHLLLWKIKKNG